MEQGGPGAAGAAAGPGLDEEEFQALLMQARAGETAAVLAAVDQDKRLATRATVNDMTLLHCSCLGEGHMELAGALLERGADVHAKSSSGRDACYWACYKGNLALVALLLDKGASPHTRVPNYHSCISLAAAYDHLPVVLLLISKGADLLEPTFNNRTALEWWGEHKHNPRLSRAELASRRAEALAAFRAGPHPREVQRRADERWARRWPFMQVAVGHGFRPLAHQQALLAAAALPPSAVIPSLTAPRPALLRDKVLTDEPLFKRIMSYV
jgi:hypothetical protein